MLYDEQVELLIIDPTELHSLQTSIPNSYSIGDWIRLLSMYKRNQNWRKVDETVREMDRRFLLKEKFWITEIEEKVKRSDGKEQVKEVFELADRAWRHGEYAELGRKCANYAVEMYSKGLISMTYAQAKLQQLIQIFKDDLQNGSFYFHKLRKLYSLKTFPDCLNRTRRSYHRQLKLPFTSLDVDFSEYLKWQLDSQQADRMQPIYEQTKRLTDEIVYYAQQRQFEKMPAGMVLAVLEKESPLNEEVYLEWLEKVPKEKRVMRLGRMTKGCRMLERYLRELEEGAAEGDHAEVNAEYSRVINQATGRVKAQLQRQFLDVLVRRINKHLFDTPTQQYLKQWPSNIVFFRQQTRRLLDATKDNVKKLELLTFWADVEGYIIKDPASIISISREEINMCQEPKSYKNAAHRLIAAGTGYAIQEAMRILKEGIKYSDEPLPLSKQFKRFQLIFSKTRTQQQPQPQPQPQPIDPDRQNRQPQPQTSPQNLTFTPQHRKQQPQPQTPQPQTPQATSQKRRRQPLAQQQLQLQQKIYQEQKRRYHGDTGKTLYVKGIKPQWAEKDVIGLFRSKDDIQEVRIVRDRKGNSKGFCYVDFKTKEAAEQAENEAKTESKDGITMNISKPPKKYDAEEQTIFLCGLPGTATQQKVRALLQGNPSKDLQQIRLVKNQQGSKGFCYVQYTSPQSKSLALSQLLSKPLKLDGKRILIQQCDSTRQRTKKLHPVIFLKNLAFKVSQRDIRDFFHFHKLDSISQVELVRNERGKTIAAYVEFEKFVEFQRALDLREGRMHQRDFVILRSDREITRRRNRGRDEGERKGEAQEKEGNGVQQPLSNEDFRKMLGAD